MKKVKYIILSALSALTLTSCSLFNDDDIKVENHFYTKDEANQIVESDVSAGGVKATTSDDVPNVLVFKNIVYSNLEGGKIKNTYTKEQGFKYDVNGTNDYVADKNNNNFDLYVPESAKKDEAQNVVLFIHGGAWISGLKSHVNPYVKMFANEGYIAATIEYTLLSADMNDNSLSVFRDLDEIDACISTMKSCLVELGFTGALNLVIGGASSGAHLAMLYSYSRGADSAMPIKFIIDAVGPTDINYEVWKKFHNEDDRNAENALEDGVVTTKTLDTLPVAGQGYDWNEYQTMRIANGMCGLPFSLAEVEATTPGETKETVDKKDSAVYESIVSDPVSGEKLLSVTYHLKNADKIPMICAYAGKDSVVGVAQFANLQKAMAGKGYEKDVDYKFVYFKDCGHVDLDTDATQYKDFSDKILDWLETK